MPNLPRAILFDLDDTIIAAYGAPEAAWRAVVGEFSGEWGTLPQPEVVAAIGAAALDFWGDAERHRVWRQKMAEARRAIVEAGFARLAAAGHAVPGADLRRRLADRFSAYRNENITLYPDAHATLDALRGRGVKLALITNGSREQQREKIVRFDLGHRFDHIQIEGEHGFGKPEERAYHHAMAALDVGPTDCWIVGDNLEWEVLAPQKLGIHAIWYDPNGAGVPVEHAARPDRIIRALSELLD